MSSRRDSRVHLSVRQNDALLEFENFKRKYLLVNKHITKLNSTLSVRVEELNAQVSTLYVENLRLRASEISLVSELKKEKEKTQRVVDEAESAAGAFMEHLTGMRASLGVPLPKHNTASPVKRKPSSSLVQPPRDVVRLVKPPGETITQIHESDEEDEEDDTPTRTITACRPSASRLPLPKLVSTPQPAVAPRVSAIPHINFAAGATATRRKVGRRNSALLMAEHGSGMGREPSPVAGPVRRTRRSSIECEDEDGGVKLEVQERTVPGPELENVTAHDKAHKLDEEVDLADLKEPKNIMDWPRNVDRKGKARQPVGEWEREMETQSPSERDSSEGSKEKEKRRFGIKDVTNSPRKGLSEFVDEKPTEKLVDAPTLIHTTPSSANVQLFDALTLKLNTSPLLSATSTPATDCGSEAGENAPGRERRTRKSVNYAEPKLNTKMRKPDPPPDFFKPRTSAGGTVTRRRRSIPTPTPVLASDEDGDADAEGSGTSIRCMEGRRRTVHTAAINTSALPSDLGDMGVGNDPYGQWVDETRRHSMAV